MTFITNGNRKGLNRNGSFPIRHLKPFSNILFFIYEFLKRDRRQNRVKSRQEFLLQRIITGGSSDVLSYKVTGGVVRTPHRETL